MRQQCFGLCLGVLGLAILPGIASASCAVFGDSIGLGLGQAMHGVCPTSAEIGILSSVVASRVKPGATWTIVSLGSNDFPKGLNPAMIAISETRVRKALADVAAKITRGLILVLPANDGRTIVSTWASEHGVATLSFKPGADGVHPLKAGYDGMAREAETIMNAH